LNKIAIYIAYLFLPLFALAQQNLVLNGDFEQYSDCPTSYSDPTQNPKEIEKCIGWKTPTYGTSDYYNTCAVGTFVDVPLNGMGEQIPFNGNGYLGTYLWNYNGGGDDGYSGPMWWEYIQGQFTQPLETGKVYKFSMEVSLAEFSDLMITEMGVYFSDYPISSPNTAALAVSPQIVFYEPNYFRDTANWVHLETYYVANGTEKYLTIGNFRDDVTSDTLRRFMLDPPPFYSYYYFDNVSLIDADNELSVANVFTPNGDGVNDLWKLPFADGNSEKQVYILNRWGNLIFQGSLNGFYWDGNDLNGNAVNDGVYFYKVSDTNISGFIQLIANCEAEH
jgi:gliding motility-associated-like protein